MKPCHDLDTILRLMEYHQAQVQYHADRVQKLSDYAKELMKPGFKLDSAWIITD